MVTQLRDRPQPTVIDLLEACFLRLANERCNFNKQWLIVSSPVDAEKSNCLGG
jgi:hypothetical protein